MAAAVLLAGAAYAADPSLEDDGQDQFEIAWQGPSYHVTYSFMTACPADTLYAIFLDPLHVRRCMGRANLAITTLDSAASRNRLSYAYTYVVSKLHLTFDRRIDSACACVAFSLDSCRVTGSKLIPTVKSSRGHYKLVPEGDSMRVDYWQETTLDRDLNRLYIHFIRRDTRRVLRNQERYARMHEPGAQ